MISPINDVGKTGYSHAKELNWTAILYHSQKLTQIKNLNVMPETVKLLEDNIGRKLLGIGLGNDFLNMTPKAQKTKAKIK